VDKNNCLIDGPEILYYPVRAVQFLYCQDGSVAGRIAGAEQASP
jgi:hypothetical protein